MDDRFLHDQRREPGPGYGRALRERLRGLDEAPEPRGFRLHPAFATALAAGVVAVAFTFPAVRAAAQNALDLFRVRSFTAVEFDESRMEQLKQLHDQTGKGPAMLVFDKQEVLQEPGPPVDYPSADLAASAAGLPGLRQPASLPGGLKFEKAVATGQGAARLTVNTERLRQVLEALSIRDVQVPQGLDGQSITVHMPASVTQRFVNGKRRLTVMEAMSPEVTLPPGADLRQLGELGLRVLGLDAKEARRMAASIDWRSTLLVPVPASAASFRTVDVNGHKGLLIRANPERPGESGKRDHVTMVMWTEGDRVLAVQGNVSDEEVLVLAHSLR